MRDEEAIESVLYLLAAKREREYPSDCQQLAVAIQQVSYLIPPHVTPVVSLEEAVSDE